MRQLPRWRRSKHHAPRVGRRRRRRVYVVHGKSVSSAQAGVGWHGCRVFAAVEKNKNASVGSIHSPDVVFLRPLPWPFPAASAAWPPTRTAASQSACVCVGRPTVVVCGMRRRRPTVPTSPPSLPKTHSKQKKLLKNIKFDQTLLAAPVDLARVNWAAVTPWIEKRVTELLGVEDDVLNGYIAEQLVGQTKVDPRELQINLTGFLGAHAAPFVAELWSLLASASANAAGIPARLLADKAAELAAAREARAEAEAAVRAAQARLEASVRGRGGGGGGRHRSRSPNRRRRRSRSRERRRSRSRDRRRRSRSRERRRSRSRDRRRRSRSGERRRRSPPGRPSPSYEPLGEKDRKRSLSLTP